MGGCRPEVEYAVRIKYLEDRKRTTPYLNITFKRSTIQGAKRAGYTHCEYKIEDNTHKLYFSFNKSSKGKKIDFVNNKIVVYGYEPTLELLDYEGEYTEMECGYFDDETPYIAIDRSNRSGFSVNYANRTKPTQVIAKPLPVVDKPTLPVNAELEEVSSYLNAALTKAKMDYDSLEVEYNEIRERYLEAKDRLDRLSKAVVALNENRR